MAVAVQSHSLYDNYRSKLIMGVTDKGTVYLDLAPIYEAYIGVMNPEPGARVYNHESSLFIPMSMEMILQTIQVLDELINDESAIEKYSTEPAYIGTGGGKRVINIFTSNEGIFAAFIIHDDSGNEIGYLEHQLDLGATNSTNVQVPYINMVILKSFLEQAIQTSFKLIFQGAANYSSNNSGGNNSNGGYYNNNNNQGTRIGGGSRRGSMNRGNSRTTNRFQNNNNNGNGYQNQNQGNFNNQNQNFNNQNQGYNQPQNQPETTQNQQQMPTRSNSVINNTPTQNQQRGQNLNTGNSILDNSAVNEPMRQSNSIGVTAEDIDNLE